MMLQRVKERIALTQKEIPPANLTGMPYKEHIPDNHYSNFPVAK